MKILFIHTNIVTRKKSFEEKKISSWFHVQMGISYISSYLKSKGHETELLYLSQTLWKNAVKKYIEKFSPKLICFTAVATQFKHITRISKYIKKNYPNIFLLAGGPHITLNPSESIKSSFDAICIGEGEKPTAELIEYLEKGQIPKKILNLWIKHQNLIIKNKTRPFLQNLDQLPYPDRKIWRKWMHSSASIQNMVLLSRGCPFQCSYCCNHALQKTSKGKYVRFRKPERIINELKVLIEKFPQIKEVYFETEAITIDLKFLKNLCNLLKTFNVAHDLKFSANIRIVPGTDYETVFKLMSEAEFYLLNMGIESGNPRIREKILRRRYSNDDVVETCRIAKKYGLKINTSNLIGLPEETEQDFKDTIKLNRVIQPNDAALYIFYPYPGTDLYNTCVENKLLCNEIQKIKERVEPVLNLPNFSTKSIKKNLFWFHWNVFREKREFTRVFWYYIYRDFIAPYPRLLSLYLNFRKPLKRLI